MSKSLSKSIFIELFGDPFLIDEKEKVPFKNAIAETVKGPFGSDMKKSLFVPKSDTTYKVFSQVNAIQKDATAGDYYISAEYYEKMKRFTVNSGDYIVTCDGTLGKIYCLPENIEKGVISSSLLRIALNKDVISNVYFETIWNMYMLPMLVRRSRNACLVHLPSAKDIGNLPVPIPNIDKQRDYDKFSNQIDKSKFILQKMIEKLELLKKSRFIELFGDIKEKNKWPREKWSDVCEIINGKDFKSVEDPNGQYAVYGTGGFMAKANQYTCPENSIIIGRKGTINKPLLVKEKFWNIDTAFGVVPNITKVHYQYFYWFCKQFNFMSINKGTTLPSTTKTDLQKIEINVPPLELQLHFSHLVDQIDKSKLILQKQLDDLVGETK